MNLYVTPRGRWAGTQADAKPLGNEDGGFIPADVPTDKPGLLAFLNTNRVGAKPVEIPKVLQPDPVEMIHDGPIMLTSEGFKPLTLEEPSRKIVYIEHNTKALSDGMSLTDAEEFIQNADAAQLARLAENVCFRMKELMERVS